MKGPKQIIDIPIAGGVESKIYKALVQPGKSLRSDGVRFDRPGAVSLAPTLEEYSEETGGVCTGMLCDGTHEPVTLNANDIDPVRISRINIPPPSSTYQTGKVYSSDVAVYGDNIYSIVSAGGGFHSVIKTNTKTGESSVLLASGSSDRPFRIIICGSHRYVFYVDAVSSTIRYYYRDLSSGPDIIGTVYNAIVVASASVSLGFTVCKDSDPTREADGYCWLCWCNGANQMQLTEVHQTSYSLQKSTTDVCVASPAVTYSETNTARYWIAVPHAAGVYGYCHNVGGSSVRRTMVTTAGTYYTPVGIEYEDEVAYWYCPWETAGAYPHYLLTRIGKITTAAGSEQSAIIYGVHPSSTPIVRDFHTYFWVRYIKAILTNAAGEEQEQATEFLVKSDPESTSNLEAAYVVGSSIERDAMGPATHIASKPLVIPSTMVEDDDGAWLYGAISEPQSLIDTRRNGLVSVVRTELGVPLKQAVIADKHIMSGGVVCESASRNVTSSDVVVESGFVLYPEIISVTPGPVATGTLLAKTYYVKVLFESIDDSGRKTVSGVSAEDSALAVATGSLVVRVPYYLLGRRICRVIAYISEDNITYYLSNGFGVAHQLTGPAASYQDIIITAFDNTRPLLYTVGGIVENGNARCVTDVVAHNSRFFGVTPDGVLLYSKPLVGGVGIEWSPFILEHKLLSDAGRYWQLASMDGQLIAIGENGAQIIVGDGADNLGSNSTLSEPVKITSSKGVVRDTFSIQASDGVWHQSKSGIELFTRAHETDSLIGLPIHDSIGSALLKSGVEHSSQDEVMFGMSDGEVHVFDTVSRSWSTLPSYGIGGDHQAITNDSDGNLWVLNSSTKDLYVSRLSLPDYTGAQAVIETPWLRVGSVGGRQRLSFVVINGEWLSDMTLSGNAYFNFDETSTYSFTDDYEGLSVGDPIVWRKHIGTRCSSVKLKVTIEKSDGAVAGACCRLFGMSVELAQKPALLKASSSHER